MNSEFLVEYIGGRFVCLKGVGKLFYQDGVPISIAVANFKKTGVEVSMLHLIEEFWDNGWSWKTIEMKLRGEMYEDIDNSLKLDFDYLKKFYDCLEQPKRANGGYEESREMIFQYLFNGDIGLAKSTLSAILKTVKEKLVKEGKPLVI